MPALGNKGGLSLVPMSVQVSGNNQPVVVHVDTATEHVTIDLSEHQVLCVPEDLRKLKGYVTTLKIKSLALDMLPQWLGELSALEKLDLTGCEAVRELPGEIGGLTALQTLDLSLCSGLTSLPGQIGGL